MEVPGGFASQPEEIMVNCVCVFVCARTCVCVCVLERQRTCLQMFIASAPRAPACPRVQIKEPAHEKYLLSNNDEAFIES